MSQFQRSCRLTGGPGSVSPRQRTALVAILLLSLAIRRAAAALAAAGVVLALLGLVGTVLSAAGQFSSALYLGLGVGGSERLAGYPGNLWMLIIGVLALAPRYRSLTTASPRR